MLSAFQTYGQPMFDTLESWIKLGMVRRARKARKSTSTASLSDASSDLGSKSDLKSERRWPAPGPAVPACSGRGGTARPACPMPPPRCPP